MRAPWCLDNLVTGRREFAAGRAVSEGDIADGSLVDRLFAEHPDIDAGRRPGDTAGAYIRIDRAACLLAWKPAVRHR